MALLSQSYLFSFHHFFSVSRENPKVQKTIDPPVSSVCGFERPRRWGSASVLGQLEVSSFGLSLPFAHQTFCMKVTIKNCKPYCWAYHPLAVPPERLFVVVFEVKPVGHPRVIRNHCGGDVKNCDWDPQGIANKPTIKPDPDVARRHDHWSSTSKTQIFHHIFWFCVCLDLQRF